MISDIRNENVASMFFIDLVGCAVAPVVFWLILSLSGVTLVTVSSTLGYAFLAHAFLRRR